MLDSGENRQGRKWRAFFRRGRMDAYLSPLSRKLTVAVFLAILLVETAIFFPSYFRHEVGLQEQLRDLAKQWIQAATIGVGDDLAPEMWAKKIIKSPNIEGLTVIDSSGDILVRVGEEVQSIDLSANPKNAALMRVDEGRRLEVVWPADTTTKGLVLVARLNSEHIDQELRDFVLRIGGLVLVISAILTLTTLIAMGDVVLKPLISLRDILREKRHDSADGEDQDIRFRDDEIGEVYRTTHALLEELKVAHDDLERRVAERTKATEQLNQKLTASEARFRDFAEAASDWFWEMDENLRFSYFSDRFTAVTGVPQSALLGVTREENGNPGATPEDWRQHLEDLHAHRPFKDFKHPRIKPDGSEVWLSISGSPVFENGVFKGYRGTGTDFTHRRSIERELLETKEHAERANRAKSEFLANMSHELRTPLNAILGFSEIMADELMGPQTNNAYRDYSADIRSSALHLLEVINDILDISKIEANELILEEHEIDVAEIVEESVRILSPRATAGQLSFRVLMPPERPRMRADARMLKQILINILSNAVKFTPAGGVVSISCHVDSSAGILIKVTDTGIGISETDLPRIVEPFTQVRLNSRLASEGTGLGLSLVKKLTELHGGDLQIESKIDQGTSVILRFPPERIA